jgi:hypothetical protein
MFTALERLLGCSILLVLAGVAAYALGRITEALPLDLGSNPEPESSERKFVSLEELGKIADEWDAIGKKADRTTFQIEKERSALLAKFENWEVRIEGIIKDVRSSYDVFRPEAHQKIVLVDVTCRMKRSDIDFDLELEVAPPLVYYSLTIGRTWDHLLEFRKGRRVIVTSPERWWVLAVSPESRYAKINGDVTAARY